MKTKYDVYFNGFVLAEQDIFIVDEGYTLVNDSAHQRVILKVDLENVEKKNHPGVMCRALDFALPRAIVSPYCQDAINEVNWRTKVLYSHVADRDLEDAKYILKQNDLEKIRKWYLILSEVNQKKCSNINWHLSYDEYNNSLYLGAIEHAYVNLATALESIVLKDNYELQYRVALYTAMICGDNENERKEIFDKVKKGYNLRSKVTHGDMDALTKEMKKENIFEHFFDFREIVSTTLYKTWGKSKQETINEIEKKIFS